MKLNPEETQNMDTKIVQLLAPSRPFAAIIKNQEGPGYIEWDVVAWALYDDGDVAALILDTSAQAEQLFPAARLQGFERLVDSADPKGNGRDRDTR